MVGLSQLLISLSQPASSDGIQREARPLQSGSDSAATEKWVLGLNINFNGW